MRLDMNLQPRIQTPNTLQAFHSRVIAVASGKGGVGKTNLTINLGLALARRNLRVAILDADLGTANVDVVLGIRPRYHLQHVVTGQKSLSEIIVAGPFGLQIIPGASGLPDLADLAEAQREILLRALLALDGQVDLLLIDTSAGVGASVVQFILAAGELLLVTTPEPTAITDAYALVKILASYRAPLSIKLVVNSVQQRGEGEATSYKLMTVAEQFLGRRIELAGLLPYDRSVAAAVNNQCPLLQSHPRSPAALAIDSLAERLWNDQELASPTTSLSKFFRSLLAFNPLSSLGV